MLNTIRYSQDPAPVERGWESLDRRCPIVSLPVAETEQQRNKDGLLSNTPTHHRPSFTNCETLGGAGGL